MQKQTVVLLLVALLGVGAAVFLVPGLSGEAPAPVMQWDTGDEVDGATEEAPENGEVQTAEFDRTEAAVTPGAPVAADPGERIDALLRGRVVDKFGAPVAGAKVWMEIGQSRQRGRATGGRGGRGGGRSRRIPEPVETNAQGLFAFQGQAFRNLRVTLQVKSDQHAVGLFEKDIGDIRAGQASAEVEVALGDLQLKSGGLVRGRVTDLGGNAVMGAAVTLEPDFRNRLRWQRNRGDLLPPTTTDANGYYAYANVPEGRFAVTVLAKMHTPGRSETFEVAEEATVEVPDIALGPGYEVTGIVRDARGEPVAKANVRLRASLSQNAAAGARAGGRDERGRGGRETRGRGGFRGMSMFGGRDHRTETDEEGRFLLEHLPGSLMELEVRAEGFLTYEEDEIDPRTGRPIYVTLQDGLRITGLVQTPDGLPLTSYAVRARRLRGLPDPNQPQIDFNSLWSKMSNPDLSEDARRDLMRQMRSARDQFTRQFGDRGGRGGGRGSDRGGRGGDRGGRGDMEPEPHDGGRFVEDGLLEGVYEVLVEAPDYARYRSAEVEVRRSAAPADLTITLDRGVYVGGVVLDAYGDPIADAEVTVRSASLDENNPPTPSMFGGQAGGRGPGGRGGFDMNRMARDWMRGMSAPQLRLQARTDEDGLFIVKNVPRGVYALAASAEGFAQGDVPAFQLNGDRSDFELRLEPLGVIYGEVTGFRPEEAGEVQVGAVLLPEDGNIMGAMMRGGFGRGGRGGRGGGRSMSTARVEADGSYRLEGLTPGDYLVRTWIGGTREIMRMMQPMMMSGELTADVGVQAGAESRWDMQVLRPQVGDVTGSVMHNGDYASGFRVELRQQDQGSAQGGGGPNDWMARMARFGRSQSATVKADGTFEIKDVTAGAYTLRISASRRGGTLYEEPVQVLADATVQRSFALTTGSVQGTVTTDDGADAKAVRGRVTLFADLVEVPENLRQAQRETRSFDARISDGAFEIASIPAGTYLLVAQPRDREQTSQTVVVTGREQVTVPLGKSTQQQNGGPPK